MTARTLFGKPVYFESSGRLSGLGAVKTCRGCKEPRGLGALGTEAENILKNITGAAQDFFDGITGAKSNREAQAKQLLLAQKQVEARQAEAEARNEVLEKVLPVALAVGGAIVALGIVGLILRKKG